ncbi:dephospho-CoA kinase [Candidatus Bipolaricaulota bacterium]
MAGRAGSGKSAVARCLARKPAVEWIDLDAVAWDTYTVGTAVYERLLEAFGEEILNESGEIDRIRLAEAAFANHKNRETLNAIVHPAVSDAVGAIIREHRQKGTEILLIEGALLASSPYVDRSAYDLILWLDVPDDVRLERLQAIGRGDHGKRSNRVTPSGSFVSIPADGTIDEIGNCIRRTIDNELG